jgi:prolyl 4-hydroxylase
MYSQSLLHWLAVMAVGMGIASAGDDVAQKKLNGYDCVHPPYKSHLLSKSPLVIYIEDFVTDEERLHLQDLAYVKPYLPRYVNCMY